MFNAQIMSLQRQEEATEVEQVAMDVDTPPLQEGLKAFASGRTAAVGPMSPSFAQQAGWPGSPPRTQLLSTPAPGGGAVAGGGTVAGGLGIPPLPGQGGPGVVAAPPGVVGGTGVVQGAAGSAGGGNLDFLCGGQRYVSLNPAEERLGADIYFSIRRKGFANYREWVNERWQTAPDTQNRRNIVQNAILADMRIAEFQKAGGAPSDMWGLEHDDQLEVLLTQLASANEFLVTGDSVAANAVLAVDPSGSVLPQRAKDKGLATSKAVYQQNLRSRKQPQSTTQPKGKAKAKANTQQVEPK